MVGVTTIAVATLPAGALSVFVKGAFHQHASQPWQACHRGADDIDAGGVAGGDYDHEQDDGGTDADVMLKAFKQADLGYDFIGIMGNEELATAPKKNHGFVTLNVMENQMAAVCTKGEAHCKHPCDPVVPDGSGPWKASEPHVNNMHREYIQGVPGVFVQHPTTDPQREEMLTYMKSGHDNVRGMEIFNSWVEQAWDIEMPRNDEEIDSIYPWFNSVNCLAWAAESAATWFNKSQECSFGKAMPYWDETLRALKRPVYGLADDDAFVYTGDSDDTHYKHKKADSVQTETPAWFRFGVGYVMVDVPSSSFDASDVSKAVDQGQFYASSGVQLSYNTSGDVISVTAGEPVIFGATGGAGSETDSFPLVGFNVTLCAGEGGVVTNIGCSSSSSPPPAATELQVDLREISSPFFYVRIQAHVRTRYPIVSVSDGKKWEFELGSSPQQKDFVEGRMLHATGESRRPFLVQSVTNTTVRVVSHFSHGYGDITPDSTTLKGIVAGTDQLVAERWAWMQPVFRRTSETGQLQDPYPPASSALLV